MRITELNPEPTYVIPFLNAGRRRHQFFEDKLPVYHGLVDELPDSLDCIVATADLQGREVLGLNPIEPPRLLGEVLPELLDEPLAELGIVDRNRVLAILGGDFYTYEDLRGRGGTGDVNSVWQAIGEAYGWTVGVAGNHDMFGQKKSTLPNFKPPLHILHGNRVDIEGISIACISGVIGNPENNFRHTLEDYLETLEQMHLESTDVLVMHDGPDSPGLAGARGNPAIRETLERTRPSLVIRGHSHWPKPLSELKHGVQVLNVDCNVVILTNSE